MCETLKSLLFIFWQFHTYIQRILISSWCFCQLPTVMAAAMIHVQKTALHRPSSILSSFCPLFSMFSEPWAVDTDVKLRTEHSTVTYSLHFGYLWVSTLTNSHCSKKLLWLRLEAPQIYRYTHKYLEYSLTMWPFSKTTDSKAMGFDQVYNRNHKFPPLEQTSHLVRKHLVIPLMFMLLLDHLSCCPPIQGTSVQTHIYKLAYRIMGSHKSYWLTHVFPISS